MCTFMVFKEDAVYLLVDMTIYSLAQLYEQRKVKPPADFICLLMSLIHIACLFMRNLYGLDEIM